MHKTVTQLKKLCDEEGIAYNPSAKRRMPLVLTLSLSVRYQEVADERDALLGEGNLSEEEAVTYEVAQVAFLCRLMRWWGMRPLKKQSGGAILNRVLPTKVK